MSLTHFFPCNKRFLECNLLPVEEKTKNQKCDPNFLKKELLYTASYVYPFAFLSSVVLTYVNYLGEGGKP